MEKGNETQKNEGWEEVNPDIWKPDKPGDEVSGTLLHVKKGTGKYENSNIYTLDRQGGPINFWGTKILDDRMSVVQIGQQVRIIYEGIAKSKQGQEYHQYKVFRRKFQLRLKIGE